MDAITKDTLLVLANTYPRMAIRMSQQFMDGTDVHECGFVPNDWDGGTVEVVGQWWHGKGSATIKVSNQNTIQKGDSK